MNNFNFEKSSNYNIFQILTILKFKFFKIWTVFKSKQISSLHFFFKIWVFFKVWEF
jgi:hypothetical protein